MKRFRGTVVRGPHTALAVRRGLAAVAVLAVTAGCSARAVDAPSVGTDDAPPGSTVPGGIVTPSATPSAAPSGLPTGGARPEPSEEPDERPTEQPSARPAEVLMSEGAQGARVRELQARLAQIGWFDDAPTGVYGRITVAAVKGFQGKRGLPAHGATDTVTWQRLLGMTTEPTRGELDGKAVNKPTTTLDPRCLNGRVMCVSKTTRTLSWVVDGTVRSTMDVRFGSQYTPTREGSFSVFLKSRDHVSTLYDTPMPYAMFFSGGQAVHYSSDFAARGYSGGSHGCVNVRDRQAIAALYAQVRNGDKVVIHW
ncbi:L,D-transpeptidase family protein [Streptomyces sp. NPDC005963]|uniref:L,D-transpeptidase family protein n=1 Tax=Streptomyces sp. NPDC005963 TaxID=3156721 RepID=UPI0033D70F1C